MSFTYFLATLTLIGSQAFAVETSFNATLFKDNKSQEALFTFNRKVIETGDERKVERRFESPDGKLAVYEEYNFLAGKLVSFTLKQNQTSEEGSLLVKDGEAFFTYTKGGKTKTAKEKYVENFVSTDEIYPFLKKNWAQIMEGKTLDIRFPVLDRLETVGFKFFKEKETTVDGVKQVVVKMKPTSFIIAALVDPLLFTFDQVEATPRLLLVDGRAIPKIQDGGKWKELNGHLKFAFNAN